MPLLLLVLLVELVELALLVQLVQLVLLMLLMLLRREQHSNPQSSDQLFLRAQEQALPVPLKSRILLLGLQLGLLVLKQRGQ